MENSVQQFSLESAAEAEKEKREMSNKRVKVGGILILCLLLLNFVLVVIVMNRTSKFSSPSSTSNFSAAVNQTHKTGKIVGEMKFELGRIEKWRNSTEKKCSSHQIQIQALSNRTKIDKQIEALENENQQLKKSHEKLKEQFESLSQKLDQTKNNISSGQNVSPLEMTTVPAENEDSSSIDPQSLQNCRDAMEIFSSPRSAKQRIYPHGNGTSLEVLCDFEIDGGGWTIIQKRSSGPKEEFKQNWTEYQNGFGSLDGNFWLGLDNIRALTKNGDQELRIQLEDFEGNKRWAQYSNFSISDASDFYRLTLYGFSRDSTLQDDMEVHIGERFSTIDKDNDPSGGNCAESRGGGWWFGEYCGWSNLNGLYFEKGETVPSWKGIFWESWKGYSYSMAKSEMKIRSRKSKTH